MTEKQSLAWNLYMQTGLTQQKIAELTGVNRKTLYDWMKQGNWSRARTASAHAPGILLDQYYGQLVALNDNIASRDEIFPTREDTVIMTRVNSVIKTLLPDKKSLAATIEHFTDFSEIVKDKFPDLGDQLSTLIGEYISDVLVPPYRNTQPPIPNSHYPAQHDPNSQVILSLPKSPIPNSENGVQDGVCFQSEMQPQSATSTVSHRCHGEPVEPQKWGATGGPRNTSLPEPTLGDSRRGEGRGEAPLPTPRNRAERRAQERLLKKVMKAKHAA